MYSIPRYKLVGEWISKLLILWIGFHWLIPSIVLYSVMSESTPTITRTNPILVDVVGGCRVRGEAKGETMDIAIALYL